MYKIVHFYITFFVHYYITINNNSEEDEIDANYIVIGYFLLLSDINKQELTKENLERLNLLLYADVNNEYFENNKSEINILKDEIQELKKDIESNPWVIIDFLSKTMK